MKHEIRGTFDQLIDIQRSVTRARTLVLDLEKEMGHGFDGVQARLNANHRRLRNLVRVVKGISDAQEKMITYERSILDLLEKYLSDTGQKAVS